jgi:uncharacterized protein (TIGR03083 family)
MAGLEQNNIVRMDTSFEPLQPIFTAHLFPKLEAKLIELLRSLTPQDWEKQTVAPKWKVKDVTAHLLDTQLRKVAASRRNHDLGKTKIVSHAELLALVNSLNADGVRQYGQLSTDELISQMEAASRESAEYHQSLDPFALAMFPVSWAGEETSSNWFDTAREFTERWHHQQQIRLAVEKPGIMTREFYYPVIDCFLRALPYAYRDVPGKFGALVQFNVSGECGGSWYLFGDGAAWKLAANPIGKKISETTIPQEIAWRIFTKGITRDAAKTQIHVTGDAEIGVHVLKMVSIVG